MRFTIPLCQRERIQQMPFRLRRVPPNISWSNHTAEVSSHMPTLLDLEPQALTLSPRDRASLASALLFSLPPLLHDEDDGVVEALRREAEAEHDPDATISLEELQRGIAATLGR